jgi:hypothetical protein
MLEEQMQFNTTDRQLLYDIRTELRKTNELLSKQTEALCAIAKHIEPKEEVKLTKVKQVKAKDIFKVDKPKRGKINAKDK